jgi:hypothetical protein
MPKEFHAIGRIEHGEEVEAGTDPQSGAPVFENRVTIFEPGAKVEGLSPEKMKELWLLGVLEERDVPEPVVVYRDRPSQVTSPAPAATSSPQSRSGTPSPATPVKE